MMFKPHPYHLVQLSPWPVASSLVGALMTLALIFLLYKSTTFPMYIALMLIMIIMLGWWRDVIREALVSGLHTNKVQSGLSYGMLLFIASEVMFFFAFFWAFFHSSLSPTGELGALWPPSGLVGLNPMGVPLLNTAVLLASGASVTWAHHGLINNYRCELSWGLGVTILLGVYFTMLQKAEYNHVDYSVADSVFGSTFFVATGFHGLHVLIGSSFLFIMWIRGLMNQFSSLHHKGMEFAAWYWHFVDVVWIFLFVFIYWWAT